MVFFCGDHAAVGAAVEQTAVGIARHDARRSADIPAAVVRIPLRHRQLEEIDLSAAQEYFL